MKSYNLTFWMTLLLLVVLIVGQWSDLSSGQCSSENKCRCEQYLSGWNIDCSGLDLTVCPKFYGIVYSVNLSYNVLTEIPVFNNTTNLEHLDLSWNEIVKINSSQIQHFFKSLKNLKSLNLSHNNISVDSNQFTNETFKYLHSLENLDISFNLMTNKSLNIDEVFFGLVQLRRLSIDAVYNLTFGSAFSAFSNLTSLKIQGRCNQERLLCVNKNFFQYLEFIEHLDVSADSQVPDPVPCSLQYIEKYAISSLRYLKSLDLSYNRQLGFCGFNNVTADLHLTQIIELKANLIQCEHGTSTILFCNDLQDLYNTSLEYLSLDGNNIASAQTGILHFLPISLKWLSIRDNRFVLNRYAYCNLYHLVNLKYVDISNINSYEKSDENTTSLFCEAFTRDIFCQIQRGKRVATNDVVQLGNICINGSKFPCAYAGNDSNAFNNSDPETYQDLTRNESIIPLTCVDPFGHENTSYSTILIPPNLETLILNNSQLGYNFGWSAFSWNSLKKLVLSNNQLYSITGPICNVSNLLYLDISHNHCSTLSAHVFSDMISLQVLNLNYNLIGFFLAQNNYQLFKAQTSLQELYLSSNRITSLHIDIFENLVELRHLYLDNNKISDWTFSIKNLINLKYIDLSDNEIMYFSNNGISLLSANKATNLTINLENNLLQCTCESLYSLHWMMLNQKLFANFSSYRCNDRGNDFLKNAVMKLNTDCASHITVIIVTFGCLVSFLSIIVPSLLYKNRWRIRYWYYLIKRRFGTGYQPQINDHEYTFDAYLSYAEKDRTIIHDVIKNLEEPHGYKMCIRHRDFIPGCDIADNIINAIHQSRKVIFIITRLFLQSSWCLFEVRMTLTEYIESRRGNNIMIIIFKEDIPQKELPDYLSRVIHEEVSIEFPQDPENEETFWTSLNESLG